MQEQKQEIPSEMRKQIVDFVNQQLVQYKEVENIYIDQKSDDTFKVVVITKQIDPNFERKLVELEDTVEERYQVPSYFKTFSNASSAAALLTQ